MDSIEPSRWLQLRHPKGFDEARFAAFCAQCGIFEAYCEAVLARWFELALGKEVLPTYEFMEPTLSDDRTIASLPIGGAYTIGSRAIFENASSRMLWQYFPPAFLIDLEEGLREKSSGRFRTSWRPVMPPID